MSICGLTDGLQTLGYRIRNLIIYFVPHEKLLQKLVIIFKLCFLNNARFKHDILDHRAIKYFYAILRGLICGTIYVLIFL
jgi:hypothetical protein